MELMMRRRAILGEVPPDDAPLYQFPNGTYATYRGDEPFVSGDLTIANGNEVQFYKRWGDNYSNYSGPLSNWGTAPFSLSTGDIIRTVIIRNSGTSGDGIQITAGARVNDYAVNLITTSLASNYTSESTITLNKDIQNPVFVVRPTANTFPRRFNFTIKIYVNNVRFI